MVQSDEVVRQSRSGTATGRPMATTSRTDPPSRIQSASASSVVAAGVSVDGPASIRLSPMDVVQLLTQRLNVQSITDGRVPSAAASSSSSSSSLSSVDKMAPKECEDVDSGRASDEDNCQSDDGDAVVYEPLCADEDSSSLPSSPTTYAAHHRSLEDPLVYFRQSLAAVPAVLYSRDIVGFYPVLAPSCHFIPLTYFDGSPMSPSSSPASTPKPLSLTAMACQRGGDQSSMEACTTPCGC